MGKLTTVAFERSDDLVLALQAAVDLYKGGRFSQIADAVGDDYAAGVVTETADMFVAWLRRPTSITLGTPVIEEQESP